MVNYWRNYDPIFYNKISKRVSTAVYLTAYLSHLMVGDILTGPINIIYPLGDLIVNSPIKGGSLQDILLETVLFILMAIIVMTRYYSFKRNEDIFLFRYHCKMDTFLYSVLIFSYNHICLLCAG